MGRGAVAKCRHLHITTTADFLELTGRRNNSNKHACTYHTHLSRFSNVVWLLLQDAIPHAMIFVPSPRVQSQLHSHQKAGRVCRETPKGSGKSEMEIPKDLRGGAMLGKLWCFRIIRAMLSGLDLGGNLT